MDHGVKTAERVDLSCNILCACDGFDVADDDCLSFGQGAPGKRKF
jgi:hypothetical protein